MALEDFILQSTHKEVRLYVSFQVNHVNFFTFASTQQEKLLSVVMKHSCQLKSCSKSIYLGHLLHLITPILLLWAQQKQHCP